MRRRLNVITPILVSAIALVLLPVAINVASGALPGSWHRYLWLSWPVAGLLAVLLVGIETRRSRKTCPKASSDDDPTTSHDQPATPAADASGSVKPSTVVHVVAHRDAYTAERMTVIHRGEDDRRLGGDT